MLQRTFSFWRRLVRSGPQSDSAHSHAASSAATLECERETERRLWVRFPADVPTHVQVANSGRHGSIAARVRDISLGGASLLLDHAIPTGQMITLELPLDGTGENQSVLACVVRTVPDGLGQWSIGCVFSRELSETDLEAFGASKARHKPTDQRTWVRFDTNRAACYHKVDAPTDAPKTAQVINLSASGIGLEVSERVEPGALLSVDLLGSDGRVLRTILACVVHVQPRGLGAWSLGCNFIRELTEAELKALI